MSKIEEIKAKYGSLDLVDMVHKHLIEKDLESHKIRVQSGRLGNFYPSSVGRCKRSIVYQMLGYPGKEKSGKAHLIMENGTGFHNRMEDLFEEMGIMIAPELSLKDEELRISGRSDAIVWNFLKEENEPDGEEIVLFDAKEPDKEIYRGPNNDILIVEFKSIKNSGFERLPVRKPKKEHEMQLQLYFYLTGINKGIVYYEAKDTQASKTYVIDRDEAIINQVISDIKEVLEYADKRELPEKEGNIVDMCCRYCDFKSICHPPFDENDWLDAFFEDDTPVAVQEPTQEVADETSCS